MSPKHDEATADAERHAAQRQEANRAKSDVVTVDRAVKDPDGPPATEAEVAVSERLIEERPIHIETAVTPREVLTAQAQDEHDARRLAERPVHVDTSLTPAASFLPGANPTPAEEIAAAPVHIETAISENADDVGVGIVDLDPEHATDPKAPEADTPRRRDQAMAAVHRDHANPSINPTESTPDQWIEGAPHINPTESTPDQLI